MSDQPQVSVPLDSALVERLDRIRGEHTYNDVIWELALLHLPDQTNKSDVEWTIDQLKERAHEGPRVLVEGFKNLERMYLDDPAPDEALYIRGVQFLLNQLGADSPDVAAADFIARWRTRAEAPKPLTPRSIRN